MQAILTFLGTFIAKILADNVLRWVAFKVVATALLVVILPIVLNNFLYDMIEIIMNFANSQSASSLNGAMSFSGLIGWFLTCFRIPECISVLVGALVLRATLNMIPFVRL